MTKLKSEDVADARALRIVRALRIAIIQAQYDMKNLTEADAREVLSGCLVSGDESTRHDDSDSLITEPRVDPRIAALVERFDSFPPRPMMLLCIAHHQVPIMERDVANCPVCAQDVQEFLATAMGGYDHMYAILTDLRSIVQGETNGPTDRTPQPNWEQSRNDSGEGGSEGGEVRK